MKKIIKLVIDYKIVAIIVFIILLIMSIWIIFKSDRKNETSSEREMNLEVVQKGNYKMAKTQDKLKAVEPEELNLNEDLGSKSLDSKGITVSDKNELTQAINNAKSGDIINLKAGEYQVSLDINKSITLNGEGEKTIIKPQNKSIALITINNSGLNLNNLILESSKIGINSMNSNLNLKNVKIRSIIATALFAQNGKINIDRVIIYDSGSAIKIQNAEGMIKNSIIHNNSNSGIEIYGSKMTITSNSITANGSYGIFVDKQSDTKIESNNVIGNTGYNVRLEKDDEIFN